MKQKIRVQNRLASGTPKIMQQQRQLHLTLSCTFPLLKHHNTSHLHTYIPRRIAPAFIVVAAMPIRLLVRHTDRHAYNRAFAFHWKAEKKVSREKKNEDRHRAQ